MCLSGHPRRAICEADPAAGRSNDRFAQSAVPLCQRLPAPCGLRQRSARIAPGFPATFPTSVRKHWAGSHRFPARRCRARPADSPSVRSCHPRHHSHFRAIAAKRRYSVPSPTWQRPVSPSYRRFHCPDFLHSRQYWRYSGSGSRPVSSSGLLPHRQSCLHLPALIPALRDRPAWPGLIPTLPWPAALWSCGSLRRSPRSFFATGWRVAVIPLPLLRAVPPDWL